MEIKVIGDSKNRKALIAVLSKFCALALKIDHEPKLIKVYSLPRLKKEKKCAGAVARMSHSEIRVLLDSRLDAEALVTVIAHEFTHVRQVIHQDLIAYYQPSGKQGWIWKGKINKSSYKNMPWEIEARHSEVILANKLRKLLAKG